MCGGEEQFFVDLKQLQISLSHPCLYCRTPLRAVTQLLFLQTFTPPLSSLHIFPPFPFPRLYITVHLGTKQIPLTVSFRAFYYHQLLWF